MGCEYLGQQILIHRPWKHQAPVSGEFINHTKSSKVVLFPTFPNSEAVSFFLLIQKAGFDPKKADRRVLYRIQGALQANHVDPKETSTSNLQKHIDKSRN